MKKKINPPECLIKVWEKIFLYEHAKFIKVTYLTSEDLKNVFFDTSGDQWTIIGQMENGDIVCKSEKKGYWTWDKWKVSKLKYPDKHLDKKPIGKLKSLEKHEEVKIHEHKQLTLIFDISEHVIIKKEVNENDFGILGESEEKESYEDRT